MDTLPSWETSGSKITWFDKKNIQTKYNIKVQTSITTLSLTTNSYSMGDTVIILLKSYLDLYCKKHVDC